MIFKRNTNLLEYQNAFKNPSPRPVNQRAETFLFWSCLTYNLLIFIYFQFASMREPFFRRTMLAEDSDLIEGLVYQDIGRTIYKTIGDQQIFKVT
jgi:hypothetical protein